MLVYGSGEGQSVMGDLPAETCPACGQKVARRVLCVWKYWHLWYLFSFVTGRSYKTVCPACGAVAVYDRDSAMAAGLSDNIPFMKRRGWVLGALAVFCVLVFVVVGNAIKAERLKGMIGAPLTGDMYMADLAKIPGSGYRPGKAMYGAMLLVEKMEDERFLVATSDTAWDKKKGLAENLEDLLYSVSELDNGEPLTLSQEELADYLGNNVIYDGKRAEGGQREIPEEIPAENPGENA